MDNFARRYKKLNPKQREAVNAIDGPVMVVAGPGTGKTELLSMRVANILKQTDALPQNILCLTFTDSGASAMRERLIDLMGQEAYRVAIHTFHSFGSEIIGQNPDYFYSGAHFRPADDLSSYHVLRAIFEKLPHNNPLSSKMNDEYTQLKSVQNSISDFKKSGLAPDEIRTILKNNTLFLDFAEPLLANVLKPTVSKTTTAGLKNALPDIKKYQEESLQLPNILNLSTVFIEQLEKALDQAEADGKTKAITAFKGAWFEKDQTGNIVFKDRKNNKKLLAASHIYGEYLQSMQDNSLFDYDDMILRTAIALELFDELRFNLQEQYQYILVDEFQDTNGSQMRILESLTNNPASLGKPNIMVVGDDDQAIYSFQGAEIGNILSFKDRFLDLKTITLTDNYRSADNILARSRQVISQGENRLENHIDELDKTLTAKNNHPKSLVRLIKQPDQASEFHFIVDEIKQRIKNGQSPDSIAVLARPHKDIEAILPYFSHQKISVNYEHKSNIFEQPPVAALIDMARLITNLTNNHLESANFNLSRLLTHPAWKIKPRTIWELSLKAHQEKRLWLEIMLEKDHELNDIAEWLIDTASSSQHQSLDVSLDALFGNNQKEAEFISPFMEYFFSKKQLEEQPEAYLSYLNGLQILRQKVSEYLPDKSLGLQDFIDFVDMHETANIKLNVETDPISNRPEAVNIMTAHKSKGQEFETVFVINAVNKVWGEKSSGRPSRLSYPANLQIAPAGENVDERLRLLFVAITRAKRELIMSYSAKNISNKQTELVSFLQLNDAEVEEAEELPVKEQLETALYSWHNNLLNPNQASFKSLMKAHLENYKISSTHVTSFLDLANCGPEEFFLQNILRFPRASSPSAAFGSAIHETLQKAHTHLSSKKERRPLEDILHDFEVFLKNKRLEKNHFEYYLQKGSDSLRGYLDARYDSFNINQKVESSFHGQGSVINGVHMTGAVDVMEINKRDKTISIIDYKTGKPALSWKGGDDQEKAKLHRYRQQLMFYKFLIENSRTYHGFTVEKATLEFVEPSRESGEVRQLTLDFSSKELGEFAKLLKAVWDKIKNIDMPDIAEYGHKYKDIIQFEEDLKKGLI